jgi:hypothetical protein
LIGFVTENLFEVFEICPGIDYRQALAESGDSAHQDIQCDVSSGLQIGNSLATDPDSFGNPGLRTAACFAFGPNALTQFFRSECNLHNVRLIEQLMSKEYQMFG